MNKNIILLTLLTLYFFKGVWTVFTLQLNGETNCPKPNSKLSPQLSNDTIETVKRYGTLM
jgi:hypothetical protein